MAVSSPLTSTNRMTKTQFDGFLKQLDKEPKNVQQGELTKLKNAGEARLPDGASTVLNDKLFDLQSDRFDPSLGKQKRAAPAKLKDVKLSREKSVDGVSVDANMHLEGSFQAEPGSTLKIINHSQDGREVGNFAIPADGELRLNRQVGSVAMGDVLSFQITGTNGSVSDDVTVRPKNVEIQKWRSGTTKEVEVDLDQRSPQLNTRSISNIHTHPTASNKSHSMVLTGKAHAAEPFSDLVVMSNSKEVGKVKVAADGSFFVNAKGITPGRRVEV
ncbi:MAG: hypothetical protein GY822_02260 [Deltaproteobacteria bacterium]|nr:hypothetical protein [Deltaproteobacteria bacterium]